MFSLELSDAEKIILFEFLHKLQESSDLEQHEEYLISGLVAKLEAQLDEPFAADYENIVEKAKQDILAGGS